ncbi:thiamine ABC transporter substrate binding subunit [Celerinatantimonas sp. YJH-8]|uniref:thiamine ABC transporter substrate binding subunit n=1 Tax=Celerinatantimonas sp. YJH-8 TaxID=3228714 RepID=UPI0038C3E3D2
MKRIAWLCVMLFMSLFSVGAVAGEPILTVYTYGSFISKWGPGPELGQMFEQHCHCQLRWVGLDDGVSILNRLRLEKSHTHADVIVGLDTNLMPAAKRLQLVQAHQIDTRSLRVPQVWQDPDFVPFDRGQFAFIYNHNRLSTAPSSLKQLVEQFPGTIVYEDPRTSTVGLGLLLWIQSVYGKESGQAWQKLRHKTVTVTKSWDEAYGMFLKGEADMVLSYTTSPVYHQLVEQKHQYQAAVFSEGHYQQIEVAAVSAYSQQLPLARQFLQFIITPEAQRVIALNNWMLPVRPDVRLPEPFQQAIQPHPLSIAPDTVALHRKAWIRQWRNAVSQ